MLAERAVLDCSPVGALGLGASSRLPPLGQHLALFRAVSAPNRPGRYRQGLSFDLASRSSKLFISCFGHLASCPRWVLRRGSRRLGSTYPYFVPFLRRIGPLSIPSRVLTALGQLVQFRERWSPAAHLLGSCPALVPRYEQAIPRTRRRCAPRVSWPLRSSTLVPRCEADPRRGARRLGAPRLFTDARAPVAALHRRCLCRAVP